MKRVFEEDDAPKACLPLYGEEGNNEEDDESQPPADGFEYLRRVRKQAKLCPSTVVAKNRDKHVGKGGPIQIKGVGVNFLEKHMVPEKGWRMATLAQFRDMRTKYEEIRPPRGAKLPKAPQGVPASRDGSEWKAFCFGGKNKEPHKPALDVLLSLEQVTVSWLVVCHKNWLCNSPVFPSHSSLPYTRDDQTMLAGKQGHHLRMAYQALWGHGEGGSISWLYSLLVCLEEPLVPADQTALAELLWSLCQLWRQLDAWGYLSRPATTPSPPPKEHLDTSKLIGLVATLVTVIHCYFKQGCSDALWERDVL